MDGAVTDEVAMEETATNVLADATKDMVAAAKVVTGGEPWPWRSHPRLS